jgi:GNAT superfamily N-acetyltransferase
MVIRQIDTRHKSERKRFINMLFDLYRNHPLWVPPILIDAHTQLRRDQHPFYEHSEADFFLAERDGQVVGRVAALVNKPYNQYHGTRQAQFYLFECIEDLEVAQALMERVEEWARQRGLNTIVGPKGFGALDGYGMLVEGYEFRPAMTMMNYNPPYYPILSPAIFRPTNSAWRSVFTASPSAPPSAVGWRSNASATSASLWLWLPRSGAPITRHL